MRILVVRFSSLGDVVLTTSVLSPLKEMGFSVDFLTFKPFGEILRNQPFIDRVLEVDRKGLKSLSQIRSLAEELQNYEFGIDLHNVLRTKLLRKFLPFKTYVYEKKSFLRRIMVLFKPFKSKWLYVPELYATALKRAGIEVENPRPVLYPNLKIRKEFKKKLPENLIALSPGARWETKRYPLKKFREVIGEVKRKGFHPVVVGGKEEENLGKELEGEGVLNFCGKLTLSESLALISLTKGVISNDSAVVHIARALKVPVVSIFGPTHPAFGFAPYPDEGISITLNLPCSPCSLHGKTRCKEQRCFNIPPKKVVDKLFSLMEVN